MLKTRKKEAIMSTIFRISKIGLRKMSRVVATGVAYVLFMGVYILTPLTMFVIVVSIISHGYIMLENATISKAQAMYVEGIEYVAVNHGYKLDTPIVEIPKEERTLEHLIYLVRKEMEANNLPASLEPLILALVYIESCKGDPFAVSPVGAKGLFQLMDETSKKLGYNPKEMFTIDKNVKAGVKWFKMMVDSQKGDVFLALKEYNGGCNRIDKTDANRNYPILIVNAIPKVYDPNEWKGLYNVKG